MTDTTVKLDKGKVRLALGDPDTPGMVLFTIILYEFKEGVFGSDEEEALDPSVMWVELNERYGTWMTEEGENRVNAILTGLTDGLFWRDLMVFQSVCDALFDGELGDSIDVGFAELSAVELMWAIVEMNLVLDTEDPPEFSRDIQKFIDATFFSEQENHEESMSMIEQEYKSLLHHLRILGIPATLIRELDDAYEEVVDDIAGAVV